MYNGCMCICVFNILISMDFTFELNEYRWDKNMYGYGLNTEWEQFFAGI